MAKKQYPAQTGHYIVKVKSGQSTDRWPDFLTARFQISVGQDYHEGEKLKAAVDWAKHRFEKVVFCVNDTLQRFNLIYLNKISENEAFELSARRGSEWIERNKPIISGIQNVEVIRWEDWKARPEYPRGFLQTEWLYNNNTEFQKSIDDNVEEILSRRRTKDPQTYANDNNQEFSALSRKYLLEELATFSLMYESEVAIDIYPGTVLKPAVLFQGRNINGAPPGLGKGHFARIDFNRNPA
jgi:tRNA-dependent cyclodipeptide synthase